MTPFYDQMPIQERTHALEMPPEVRALESVLDSFERHAFFSLDEDVPLFLLVFIADVQEHVSNTLSRASWLGRMAEKLIDYNKKISFPVTYSEERRQAHQRGLAQLLDLLLDPSAASRIVEGERLARGEWFFRESFQAHANVLQDAGLDQREEKNDTESSVSNMVSREPRTALRASGARKIGEIGDDIAYSNKYSVPADFVRVTDTALTVPPRRRIAEKHSWKPGISERLHRA